MIARGFGPDSWKLLLVIVLFWIASPVSSHLIARLETTTNGRLGDYVREKREK